MGFLSWKLRNGGVRDAVGRSAATMVCASLVSWRSSQSESSGIVGMRNKKKKRSGVVVFLLDHHLDVEGRADIACVPGTCADQF